MSHACRFLYAGDRSLSRHTREIGVEGIPGLAERKDFTVRSIHR
ncbi:hypothetical protein [Methanoculleus sp.]|nr:hypothetical protein [Methanoculleus sp.]